MEYRLPNTPISYTPSPLWDWLVDWPSDYVNSELVWTKSAKANKWRSFILVAFDFVKSVKIGRLHGSKNFVGRTQKYVCLLHVPRVFKYTASITPPPSYLLSLRTVGTYLPTQHCADVPFTLTAHRRKEGAAYCVGLVRTCFLS